MSAAVVTATPIAGVPEGAPVDPAVDAGSTGRLPRRPHTTVQHRTTRRPIMFQALYADLARAHRRGDAASLPRWLLPVARVAGVLRQPGQRRAQTAEHALDERVDEPQEPVHGAILPLRVRSTGAHDRRAAPGPGPARG